MMNNKEHATQRWQPSVVEVRPRAEYERRSFGANPVPLPDLDVVMYFETNCEEGLQGYRRFAELCERGELPGECANFTGQRGYATWTVGRGEFAKLLLAAPHLEHPK
jgi:hypothetical protein